MNCRGMLWMALWVTAPQLWIEADGCGQAPPEARLSHQVERGSERSVQLPSGFDPGQTATISTGMPFSTEVPDNGSIAS